MKGEGKCLELFLQIGLSKWIDVGIEKKTVCWNEKASAWSSFFKQNKIRVPKYAKGRGKSRVR